jgi:hypothetical protein
MVLAKCCMCPLATACLCVPGLRILYYENEVQHGTIGSTRPVVCLVQAWLHKNTAAICEAIIDYWEVALHQLCQGFSAGFLVPLHALKPRYQELACRCCCCWHCCSRHEFALAWLAPSNMFGTSNELKA